MEEVLQILNPMTSTMFWSIVVFVILVIVLWRFVLKPMIDLSPELKHPVLNKTMAELLDDLKDDTHKIYPLKASLC